MAVRTRSIDAVLRHWARTSTDIGNELRTGRHIRGITQRELGASIGVSASEVSRRELGTSMRLTGPKLAAHAAAVGLRLSVKLWPAGGGVRDAAQARYVAAFLARVGRHWTVTVEAPIPIAGDLRAIDILMSNATARIAVEVITRLADLQAQVRAAQLKSRDIAATRLIMVVAGTHANRNAMASARGGLVDAFDLDTRRILAELAGGRDPLRDGIVMLDRHR